MKYRITVLITILFFMALQTRAQNFKVDSLQLAFKNAKHDTVKVQLLVEITNALAVSFPDTVIPISNQILSIVEKNISGAKGKVRNSFLIYQSIAFGNIGYAYSRRGSIPLALEYYRKGLKTQEEIKDEQSIAISLINIGAIYSKQGNVQQALDHYLRSFKIQEKLKLKHPGEYWINKDISTTLNNLAVIHKQQGEISTALFYYNKSLEISEEIKDKKGLALTLGNIAAIYRDNGETIKALEFYRKVLKIDEEQKNKIGIAYSLNNIGNIYKTMSEKKEFRSKEGSDTLVARAMEYYQKSLKIREEIKDKQGLIFSLTNVGSIYLKLDSLQKALELGSRALTMAKQLGYPDQIRYAAFHLKKTYQLLIKPTEALEMFELAVSMRDSVNNETTKKANLKKQLQYEYEKKEMLLNAEQEKKELIFTNERHRNQLLFEYKQEQQKLRSQKEKDELAHKENLKRLKLNDYFNYKKVAAKAEQEKKDLEHKAQSKQQRLVIISVVTGFIIVMIFSIFLYRRFRVTSKQKVIILNQKEEVNRQREVAEERNKEIIDSITYADRILRAMLPSEGYINAELAGIDAKHFILFKPKDIVSGDFYWFYKNEDALFYATADSTGHGVPGGFMSMLGINLLNEIVIERKITDPGEILNKLRDEIVKSLKTDEGYTKDGMDVVFCKIPLTEAGKDKGILEYAAANNSFYIIRQLEIIEQKAQKMPVGYMEDMTEFVTRTISLQRNDVIYTFTDGYADQFGGPKGKKFKYKQLESLILSNVNESMQIQKQKFETDFESWKGELEQVDDVCIIGIRI